MMTMMTNDTTDAPSYQTGKLYRTTDGVLMNGIPKGSVVIYLGTSKTTGCLELLYNEQIIAVWAGNQKFLEGPLLP